MNNIKIELNLNDIVEDMFADADYDEFGASPSASFSEEVKNSVVNQVSNNLVKQVKEECIRSAGELSANVASEFVQKELEGIITRKLRSGELRTGWQGFKSFDELIENKLNSLNLERVITRHIDTKAQEFAKDLKLRYDNVFAAKIVQNLNEQKMLSPEIAKILLG